MADGNYAWYNSLKHGGMLIAPSRLPEFFPDELPELPSYIAERLRRGLTRLEAGRDNAEAELLSTVLEDICGLKNGSGATWTRGSDVAPRFSRRMPASDILRPRRVWQDPNGGVLPIFIDDQKRLGIGRSRRFISRVIQWLRDGREKLAVVTNARQFRLVYAGLDFDAWAEWDTDLWFAEGKPSLQVEALRRLLSPKALTPKSEDEPSPLLGAIQDSRKGEAELSSVLGERVREAVEKLITACAPALEQLDDGVGPQDIYRAATRVIMRMVVGLFAEARDLLPRENPVYYGSYSLDGLREDLSRHQGAAAERLRDRRSAWPRVIALFRLIYHGSPHDQLTILRYGGGLFRPGEPDATGPLSRALVAFESVEHAPSDFTVREILQLLCRTKVKIRRGRGGTWVDAPVDFSDLSSEYIGILYEGLLDFELRRAGDDEPVVFLALGDQPALPLTRLEQMDDRALANLVEKFKVKSTRKMSGDDEDEDGDEEDEVEDELEDESAEDEDAEGEDAEDEEEAAADEPEIEEGTDDRRQAVRARAVRWAHSAVKAGRVVKKPKSRNAEAVQRYEDDVAAAAGKLIHRVILPGEWYLVRWGGTRKGSGTFYTRPQLAIPTVIRTLLPLTSNAPTGVDGEPNESAPPGEWTPKEPKDILKLKVCDPAMGSGSFLVAALRTLTDTLYTSLLRHGWLVEENDHLREGNIPQPIPPWLAECIKDFPLEHRDYETYVRARLRRIIVERCIYGVDIDPLAVELGRLALWVETMDRELPFEFIDHKLKCGNSLVGCWFDCFQDYPLMAWEREGGDKNHTRGVHYEKEEWTKAIKAIRNGDVKREIVEVINGQATLFAAAGQPPAKVHADARETYEALAATDITEPDEREDLYRSEFTAAPEIQALHLAFDCWCAVWFWPPDELATVPTPARFLDPEPDTLTAVERLRQQHRFFHWELEFPDVFAARGDGFDAIVGNPPWETLKPNSKEFFSNIDPLYRTYGKQEGLRKQEEYFDAGRQTEHDWLEYCAYYRAMSNWFKTVAGPFGDGEADVGAFSIVRGNENAQLRKRWQRKRAGREGYADEEHPFRYQGIGDVNTYKLFLEQGYALLRSGGLLGLLTPSGIYTDRGSTQLRSLFLEQCAWEWLFGFENREGVFDIHRSFKFCPVIIRKGGETEAIRTAFMHRNLNDWGEAERHVIPYEKRQVDRFSPTSRAVLELRGRRDLEVLERIYANSVLLGDDGPDGWGIKYACEFHMTNDSKLFPPRPEWEAKGYRPDQYGRWIGPEGDVALPLYEGRMIGQFDFSQKGWVSGKGRSAVWREIPWEEKVIEPQFVMSREHLEALDLVPEWKVGQMRVTSATNTRTMIATFLARVPCGDKVATLRTPSIEECLSLTGVLNSFVFDGIARIRVGGLQVDYHVLQQSPAPFPGHRRMTALVPEPTLSLSAGHSAFACEWLRVRQVVPSIAPRPWCRLWAITSHERLRLRSMLDAIVAELYGLDWDDFAWILRGCDHPQEKTTDNSFTRTLDPKGFWRVDKAQHPELRHTVLSLVAFRDLKETIAAHGNDRDAGLAAFCEQNSGDGWMLPDTLRLADYDLGHDDRADRPQPVAAALGERFLPWQLEQSVEESWAECEQHARNILGEDGYRRLMAEIAAEQTQATDRPDVVAPSPAGPAAGAAPADAKHRPTDLLGNPLPTDLFGNVIYPDGKKKR